MAKYDFRSAYPGPDGSHLGCLTQFTLTRDESKRTGRRPKGTREATRAGKNKDVTARKIAAVAGHIARHPHDGVQASRLAKLEAGK